MRGDIELDGNVLVITRIHVVYSGVEVPTDRREAADRALASHHRSCPVSRSIEGTIAISTSWAEEP